ncbi:hypothetical protein ACU42Y_13635 [Proteus mirabilis]
MSVDQFPIITMQVFPETLEHANNWIAEMDLVLAQKQNFVLVYPPINKKNEQEDMEGMKAVRRWLKTGKMPLSQYCAGMIMTVNQQTNDKEQLMQLSPLFLRCTVYLSLLKKPLMGLMLKLINFWAINNK